MSEGNSLRAAGYGVLAFLLVAVSLVTLPPPAQAGGNINYSHYTFNFANGTVWDGNTWDEGGGNNATVPLSFGVGSGRILHVSCSDVFTDGFSDDPAPRFPLPTDGTNEEWKILSYHIDKYQSKDDIVPGDMTKIHLSCGETFVPDPEPTQLTVVKVTVPSNTQNFWFTLNDDWPNRVGVPGNAGTFTWDLEPGTYGLAEHLTLAQIGAGWRLTGSGCDNGNDPDSVVLAEGDHVTCTFVNTKASVHIEKATNGFDADTPTGPEVVAGDPVAWIYVVSNTGWMELSGVAVTDDQGVAVSCPKDTLAVGESMTCSAGGIATAGQYANLGTVTTDQQVSDSDPSHYFGLVPAVDIEKATNGFDADDPQGPWIVVGGDVSWTYEVTNTGEVPLTGVVVTDDQAVTVSCPQTTLSPGESMTCSAAGTATVGQYANLGTVTTDEGVSDEDPSHYYGFIPEEPGIDIEKATNGEDADDPTGPSILAGDPVTWTYLVSNTGNVLLTGVEVLDDQGVAVSCPTDSLDVGESMECTATGTATVGQYSNLGTVTTDQEVSDEDPSHYIGYAVGSIGDFVWFDQNKDGIQDGGEPGVAGIDVYLHEGEVCGGEPLAQTTTDVDGLYLFDGLAAGTYCVEFQLPSEYAFSPADQGGDDALDSDAATELVVLAEGEDNLSIDAGLIGGEITLEKETEVITDEMFSFEFDGTQSVVLASGDSVTFHVPGGVYSITELAKTDWDLVGIVCGDEEAQIDLGAGTATVFVPAGGSVGCTFLNEFVRVLPQVITTTTTTTAPPPTTTTTTASPTTTSTAVAGTTVETLPFTGFGQRGTGSLGVALIVLGGLVLMTVNRKETDLAGVSEEAPARSWEG